MKPDKLKECRDIARLIRYRQRKAEEAAWRKQFARPNGRGGNPVSGTESAALVPQLRGVPGQSAQPKPK